MNSPYSQLLLALQEYLAAEVPELKFIDYDTGQLEEESPPVSFPCLLISFPDTPWQQMQLYQDGRILSRFRIGFDRWNNTSHTTPLEIREDALQFFELEHKIYTKMQAWSANNLLTNPLIRLRQATEQREDTMNVRVNDYVCTFSDSSVAS